MAAIDRFITEVLETQGQTMLIRQSAQIEAKLKTHTGRLKSARKVSVTGNTLTFEHTAYERFLDMKALAINGKAVRKNRRIHNRFVYGAYSRIAERLLDGCERKIIENLHNNG